MWFPLKRAGARSYTKDLYYLMRAPLEEELNCRFFEPYPINIWKQMPSTVVSSLFPSSG